METTGHVVDCGAFRRQKRFGGNRRRGASGVGSYINKVDLLKYYFIGTGRMKRTCMLVNLYIQFRTDVAIVRGKAQMPIIHPSNYHYRLNYGPRKIFGRVWSYFG